MLLSYRWLTELLDLPEACTQQVVAEHLTMAGLEIEGVHGDVLELKITPNRPDALSHAGVARELSAILQTHLKISKPNVKELSGSIHDVVQVQIADRVLCPRYACRVIEGVSIQESPDWLRDRLTACGIRPINNVVDVTNYVLLERGHPLHAFDFDKLAKERSRVNLCVRLALPGEKLTTLDGKERILSPADLVIADTQQALALAGVMGGQSSEVTQTSVNILLESAYFVPNQVRQMARRHGLSTEGSYRFERGADPNGVIGPLDRAAQLIVEVAGGRVRREAIDIYPQPIQPVEISVRQKRMRDISGLPESHLKDTAIRDRFLKLGIETVGRLGGDAMSFRVPTFRPDVTREIDLIEEAMRLIGFDQVPSRLSFTRSISKRTDNQLELVVERTKNALTSAGFFEATNFSFGSPGRYSLFSPKHEFIAVENPLGEEMSLMRQSLLPGLLENVAYNIRHGADTLSLFEVGHVFLGKNPHGKTPSPKTLSGRANQDAWANESLYVAGVMFGRTDGVDYFALKGVLEELVASWRIPHVEFSRVKADSVVLHPGYSAQISVGTKKIGKLGRLHPKIQEAYDLDKAPYVFELNLDAIAPLSHEYALMKPIAKFPSVKRDLALVLDDAVLAGDVVKKIEHHGSVKHWLQHVQIFDIYKGDKIPAGKKSLALSIELQSAERTLTDDEVASVMAKLIAMLEKTFEAQIRS